MAVHGRHTGERSLFVTRGRPIPFSLRWKTAFRQDRAHDGVDGRGSVDRYRVLRDILLRSMQSRDQRPLDCPSAKLVFWSPGKPPAQRVGIDLEHKDLVEEVKKLR